MIRLESYRLLRVSGADRTTFLQGQLTQDVQRARPGTQLLAGWTDARGRMLMLARIIGEEDSLLLALPATLAEQVSNRLSMFILRAKARIESAPELALALRLPGDDTPLDQGFQLLEGPGDDHFQLLLGPGYDTPPAPGPEPEFALALVRAGIGEVLPETSGEFLPQMLNLDLLGAISFDKGCYVGQEIVARTHYRGRVKRRMFRYACAGAAPAPGTRIVNPDGSPAGQVVLAAAADDSHSELLAVISLEARRDPLLLESPGGQPLQPLNLPYDIPR